MYLLYLIYFVLLDHGYFPMFSYKHEIQPEFKSDEAIYNFEWYRFNNLLSFNRILFNINLIKIELFHGIIPANLKHLFVADDDVFLVGLIADVLLEWIDWWD